MNALLCLILASMLVVVGVAPVYAQTAISGSQTMSAQSLSGMGSVTVTAGSTLTIDLGTSSGLTLSGSLTNAGTIYATSQGSSAAFNMNTFTNQSGGSFASLSPGLSLTFNVSNFYNHGMIDSTGHLTVNSANALVNSGTMRAAGDVNLTSAIGNIVNSGTITATTGNININSLVNSLLVNNAGGVLQAYNGSINLGVLDALKTDITASGGDWLSKELNVYTNGGTFDARVGNLSGLLNTYAETVHVGASAPKLTLGPIDAKDPVYFNDVGGIDITGNVSVGESLVIAAAGDVTWTGGAGPSFIQARNAGQGFDITIIAGAQVVGTSPTTTVAGSPPPFPAASLVSVNGPSGLGGNILFQNGTNLIVDSSSTAPGAAGGNITMVAYSNGGGVGGLIFLESPSPGNIGTVLNASGGPGGANGNVTLIADGTGTSIHTGTIITNGPGSLANTGAVSLAAASVVGSTVYNADGSVLLGGLTPGANTTGASILLGGNIDAGNSISVTASGDIRSEVVETARIALPSVSQQGSLVGSLFYLPLANGDVGIVNTLTNTFLPTTITVGGFPFSSVALANGSRVYVGSAVTGVISVIDTATNTVVATIAVGGFPAGLAASPDSRFVYAADSSTNRVHVIDTSTNTVTTTVPVGSFPNPIAVSNASGKIYVGNSGDNTISVIDPATYTVNTVTGLAAGPASFGPCPCSTKIYVGLTDNTTVQLFTANDTLDLTPIGAPGTQGIGITPNGATAWAVSPINVTTINTLTNRTNAVASPIGLNTNGNSFVTLVGNVPTAYTHSVGPGFTGQLDVFQMSTLSAPNINLNSDSADIEVATGPTTLNMTAANGAAQVNSAGNITLAFGSAATALQVATTGSIDVTGAVTASRLDFHALNGTFTNVAGNLITASNGDFVIASPNIVNNGQLFAQNGGADSIIAMQGPRGVLNVTQGPAGVMTSLQGGGLGLITLNAAGGSSATITGGSLMPDDELQFYGNDGYTATMNVNNLGPTATPGPGFPDVAIFGRAGNVSLITAQGDLNVCGCITLNNVNGNGGNFTGIANGGALLLDGGLFTNGSGAGFRAGDITLFGNEGVFVLGPLSARGENNANGGNINVTAAQNGFALIDFADGITSAASGGNAGNITLTAPDFSIVAPVVDASSLDGNAGAIRITSTDAFTPLQIDPAGCGCNTIAGNITANSSNGNAGVIQISAAGGTEVGSGVNISASSFNGNAGAVLFSGATFNNGPVTLQNDGGIQAFSFSNPNSGVIGFATGGAAVTVTGAGGLLQAGRFISAGTLDPNTGVPLPSFFLVPIPGSPFTFQNISIDQALLVAPFLALSAPLPPTPSTPVTPAVTPTVTPPVVRQVSFATLGAFPNLLPNTTIISTDQENQDFPTGAKNPLYQGFLEMRRNAQQPLLYGLYIDGILTEAMTGVGGTAVPGSAPNTVVLQSGNAFVTGVDHAIDVVTNNGIVHVPLGAAVFIMETGSGTIAYNLHDENSGSVYITSEGTRIPIELGSQVLVSNTDASFDSLNVGSLIAVRNVTKAKGPNGKTVYAAEFSLPSAIVSIDPVRQLFRSDNSAQRSWADKITRNAAILMTVANRGGAYTKTKNQ